MKTSELDEIQGPRNSQGRLKEFKQSREAWREAVYLAKSGVVEACGGAAWSGILEQAFLPGAMERFLISLAASPLTSAPPRISTVGASAKLPKGVFRKYNRFIARVRKGQKIVFKQSCATIEQAVTALATYHATQNRQSADAA